MARHYRKGAGKKRGPKKGYRQSAAHKKAISAGLRRAWRAGKFKGRKRRHGGRRRTTRAHTGGRRRSGLRRRRSSKNRTITRHKRGVSLDFHPRKRRKRRARKA